jgi:hypothetical protein
MSKLILSPHNNLSGDYQIQQGNTIIGQTSQDDYLGYDSKVKLGDGELYFEVKGFFSQMGTIFLKKEIIGTIDFDFQNRISVIRFLDGEIVEFKKAENLANDWNLISLNEKKVIAKFSKELFSSEITIDVLEENIYSQSLIIGIFICKYFKKKINIIISITAFTSIIITSILL